jgi:hypothetical protein
MASPNAQCSIHPSGQNAPAGVAVADDQGVVRFYTPPASWGRKLSVDCASGNTTVTYAVDLTAPSAFPTSSNTVSAPKVRPALTGDPTTYSQQWLVRNDYLMRPDPKTSPAAYAAWLKAASRPVTIGHKEPIARLDQHYDNFKVDSLPNWAGLVLNAPGVEYGVQYVIAAGVFGVPPTYSMGGDTAGKSAVWVGLDGLSQPDILQIGIEADYNEVYTPWIEYYPNNPLEINNLTVSLNDQLFVEVWASAPSSLCTQITTAASPVWACGGIDDNTTGQSSGVWVAYQPTVSGNPVPFTGEYAEFIVERLCKTLTNGVCTAYSPLTNFQQIWINGAAEDSTGSVHDLATDFYFKTQMVSGSKILATSQDSDGTSTEVVTFNQAQ